MEKEEDRDFYEYMSKVDQIGNIIKELNSKDNLVQKEALGKADSYLKKLEAENDLGKVKYNRTVINHEAFKNMVPNKTPYPPQSHMNQDKFMEEMALDAKERAENRKIRETKAEILKKLGNEEFRKENYERALQYYNEAISQVRDSTVLYTNRAQSLMKLERFNEAIKDCDWTIRIFENSFKAYVIRGKAFVKLNKFTEALNDFETAIFLEPQQKNVLQGFIEEALHNKRKYEEEQNSLNLFNDGNEALKLLSSHLENLKQQDKPLNFYISEMKVLMKCFHEDFEKIFFRAQNGMDLLINHPELINLELKMGKEMTEEQLEFLKSVTEILLKVCEDNEYNCEELARFPKFFTFLIIMLENAGLSTFKAQILEFFYILSMQNAGRITLCSCLDSTRHLRALIHNFSEPSIISSTSASTLNNISLNERFRSDIKDRVEDTLIPSLHQIISENLSSSVLKSFLTTLSNVSQQPTIRKKLNDSKLFWSIILQQLNVASRSLEVKNNEDLVYAILGLLVNLTSENVSHYFQNESCLEVLLKLLDSDQNRERSFIILGKLLASSAENLSQRSSFLIPKLFKLMKSQDKPLTKHAVRLLANIMMKNTEVKTKVAKTTSYFKILLQLLESNDETAAGNSALCLSFCIQITTKNLDLITIDTIKILLKLIEDGNNADLKKNCGSLIGNLAKLDKRFAEYLKDLNGFQILQDCIFKKHLL